MPNVFCIVDKWSSWIVKFFFGRVGGSAALSWPMDHQDRLALQHLCLGLGVFKLFFNNQPPPQQKTSYCLAIWSSQTKSDLLTIWVYYYCTASTRHLAEQLLARQDQDKTKTKTRPRPRPRQGELPKGGYSSFFAGGLGEVEVDFNFQPPP